jgi:hypothetical protein
MITVVPVSEPVRNENDTSVKITSVNIILLLIHHLASYVEEFKSKC